MADKRQDIIDRILEILQGVLSNVVHNQNELPEGIRPGIILVDGPETTIKGREAGRPGNSPDIVRMLPEIWIVMDDRKPENENLGEDLNTFRITILRSILNDSHLQTLVGKNGEIRYEGLDTDLARGREMNGNTLINISFNYDLHPSKL